MSIIKYIKRQDSGWKQSACCSGETSINLSNEIFDFLSLGMVDGGEECGITLRIYREDFENALDFIKSQLPLYRSNSKKSILVCAGDKILIRLEDSINNFFGKDKFVDYTVILYHRKEGRIYLKGLKQNGFSIRDFLVELGSALIFKNSIDGYILRIESAVSQEDFCNLTDNTNSL